MKVAWSFISVASTASTPLWAATSTTAFLAPSRRISAAPLASHHSSRSSLIRRRISINDLWQRTHSRSQSSTCLSSSSSSSPLPPPTSEDECDVLVLGSGPAARAIATLLSSPSPPSSSALPPALDVLLADSNYDRRWVPNYGVWQDEWQSVCRLFASFGHPLDDAACLDRKWSKTDCYFGGSFDVPVEERTRLDRAYCRIDRDGLKRCLSPDDDNAGGVGARYRVAKAHHVSRATSVNIYSPPGTLIHDDAGSTILLQSPSTSSTLRVRAKLIVDCTGHESRLVLRDDSRPDAPPPPGYQIAYGMLAKLDESSAPDQSRCGPYDKDAMTLFDYRTDHFPPDSPEARRAETAPTFMYVMPLNDNRVFFEETSLVARPAVSFRECRERCAKRLEHLGIVVEEIEEEEYCYIPMGGALPARDQRVVGFGGAAAMVHPSTGYHLCRAMMGAGAVARAVRDELHASSSGRGYDPDRAAARAYDAVWTPGTIAQRNFAVFGGEFLMTRDVRGLRGFFDGFFQLSLPLWGGFLAGWPGLPNNDRHETWWGRLRFGLEFVSKLPASVAVDMLAAIVAYSLKPGGLALPQSVTPLLGLPEGYGYRERGRAVGDVAAKAEARRMILESEVEEVVPVDFEEVGTAASVVATADAAVVVESHADDAESDVVEEESAPFA
ncbi:hypothetical protein ACHAXS_012243 [Conticribra weissflogii]